ncbi:MAG: helix-turn-helix transcriptional regulator [Prevotella sp.]|nr:helix-turn-helix transcriptional regulator [Prevotella sp.]
MKDRIKHIMEEQHMSQQVFADFIGLSPATLSSIFNGRTRPTLNIVEAIKNKIPDINTDWLLMGVGQMYVSSNPTPSEGGEHPQQSYAEQVLDFDSPISDRQATSFSPGVRNTHPEKAPVNLKIVDKEPRKVTEIRVYYDDQTYETFVPMKSK